MTTSITISNVLGEARNGDEILEIWRAHKATVGLSNRTFDELANFINGHCDKILGPTASKNFGPKSFAAINWTLAIKWIAVLDLEHAKFMEQHWEDRQRDISNVRVEPNRVSKELIKRAAPHVLKANGALGGAARKAKLTARQLTEIGRKGAKSRWRKWRERKRAARAIVVVENA